ncbi:MAG: permease [Chloroflexi bacterium]|nr:permease [Chloroflexota bacterium]
METTKRPFYLSIPLSLRLAAAAVAWVAAYQALQGVADYLSYHALGLDPASHLGSALDFFLLDVPKILLLLVGIVFLVGILRSYFSPERTRKLLGGKREGVGNVLAALLGVATPFCSCSAVPMFLGFVESGIPLGVTFSFLISSPMVNEVALVMLLGLFGWQIAGLYIGTGLVVAMTAGAVIGRLGMDGYLQDWVYQVRMGETGLEEKKLDFAGRVAYALEAVRDIVGRVWLYVIVGISIGAGIHGYVPESLLAGYMGKESWWNVPVAVIIGIPLYSNAAGIMPVVQALMEKGAALGTVLAFMMSVVAISLPEMLILRRVMKIQLIAVFIGVVAVGIIVVGYIFNLLI